MDNNTLSKLYRTRFPDTALSRKNDIWRVITGFFIQKFILPTDVVLDLASGYGEFINNIKASRKIAIDLNPDAQKYVGDDVAFYQGNSIEIVQALPCSPNVMFASNFLEHLPDKPTLNLLLSGIYQTLAPGGKFIILGPNLRYLPGKYWDFYDHSLGLTHSSLCEALELAGFGIEKCIDKFLPYTTKTAMPTHPILVRWYLKIPLAWRILGKQFFIIASKP